MRLAMTLLAALMFSPLEAQAFCGFYVARADATLTNQASRVVLARNGDLTSVTMANDYQGPVREFAMVVPVPTVIRQGDVKVVDPAVIDALDAYSAPRLAAYDDPNPCQRYDDYDMLTDMGSARKELRSASRPASAADLGVRIEASYSVEEYDVLILSATESTGLETWLRREGYRIPRGASEVLGSYIRQDMRFFVAKVNLDRHAASERQELRPLQVQYRSPRFGLPIRLGTVNSTGAQELLVFTVTRHGRVETSNYRTVPMPTDIDVPERVQHEAGAFFSAVFDTARATHGPGVVFQEHAWPLSIMCDPCSSDPVTVPQLTALGAAWVDGGRGKLPQAAFLTRLHLRYDGRTFPADLRFVETRDTRPMQSRYVIHRRATGDLTCEAGATYLTERAERELTWERNLTRLTRAARTEPMLRPPHRERSGGSWIPEVPGLFDLPFCENED